METTVFVIICIALSLEVSDIVCSSYPMYMNTAANQANNLAALTNLFSQPSAYSNNPTANTFDPYLAQKYAMIAALQSKSPLSNVDYQQANSPLFTSGLLNGIYPTTNPKQTNNLNGMQQTDTPKQTQTLNKMQQTATPKETNNKETKETPNDEIHQSDTSENKQLTEADVQEIVRNYIDNYMVQLMRTMKVMVQRIITLAISFIGERMAEQAMEGEDEEDYDMQDEESDENDADESQNHGKDANHKGNGHHSRARHGHQAKHHQEDSNSDDETDSDSDDEPDGDSSDNEEEDSNDPHQVIINSGIIEQTQEGYEKQVDDKTKVTFLLRGNNVIRKVTEHLRNEVQEEIFNNNILIERKVGSKITKFDFSAPKATIESCEGWKGAHEKDVDLKLRTHKIPPKYTTVMSKVTPESIHFRIIDENGYLYEEKYTTGAKGRLVLFKFNGETQCETPSSS